jgi:hypothetical protein
MSSCRRDFLRSVTGAAAASVFGPSRLPGQSKRARKAVVVTFGGGARDEETFMPDGQRNIPYLLHQLIPQGTFFSQVVNKGILGHYVATASIVTGVYETFNNFATVSPEYPTAFEYFRKTGKGRRRTPGWWRPATGSAALGRAGTKRTGPGWAGA